MAELRPHYIDVDLKKNTQYSVPVVTQNDTATHFIIRVTDDGLTDPELLDAYQEITMTSQRPDGESFYLTGSRIAGTNEIEFHLGTDETAFSGSVLASLQFYLVEDASRYTSAQFRYDVKKDLTKNYTPTQREETLVEVVLRDGPVAIQEAKDAKIAVDGALVELEQDKTAAIERLDEVTEENKTVFRQPVNTFADLATTYPNPEHGTTVRVTGESATYRYSDGSWVKTDEYNPTAIDQVTAQLAETDAEAKRKREPEDLSERTLELVTGGTVNLLTIPQDKSVTPEKTTFIKKGDNLFDPSTSKEGRLSSSGGESTESGYVITNFVSVSPGDSVYYYFDDGQTVFNVRTFLYDIEFNLIEVLSDYKSGDVLSNPNVRYIRTSVGMSTATNKFGINLNSLKPHEPYHVRFENMKILKDDIVGLEDYETLPDGVVSRYKLDEGLQQSITLPEQELTNIMLNGDFSDGVTGWAATRDGAIPTVSANVLTSEMVSTSIKGNWQLFQTNPNIVVGRKYYFAVDIKPAKNTTVSLAIKEIIKPFVNMTENTWNRVSEIMHITSAPEALNRITAYIDTNSFVPGEKISFRNFNVIDLTASYGEGNEPTKEFMDYLLKDRGYVSGTSNVTIVDEIPKLVGAFDAQIKPQDARKFTSHLYGKEMVCFGDSITGNHFINDYPSIIAKRTGMKVHNVGFGGTRIGYHEQADYDKFSFYRLVDTVISGDYSTLKQPFVNGRPTPYDARVAILEKINWNNVKYISIAYMANDWGANSPNEGATNEDVTSVKGAGRLALRKLLTAYPHLKVLIVSPFYRYFPQENPVTDSDDTPRGIQNWYMREYVEAAKELADEFHFPFVNVYNGLGINKYTRGQYFDGSDGTHHDERGRIHIGNKLASKILSEY